MGFFPPTDHGILRDLRLSRKNGQLRCPPSLAWRAGGSWTLDLGSRGVGIVVIRGISVIMETSTPPTITSGATENCPVVIKAAPDPMIGKILMGRFRINSRIARGGMGAVYIARRVDSGDLFAVKVLHRDMVLDPRMRERFLNEANAAKRIDHPAVARTNEVGETVTGEIFIVMEYVNGPPLRRLLRKGSLNSGRMIILSAAIAQGLAAAHASGVIHRDLKPENVLIPRKRKTDSVVKIVDFGIARIIDAPRITTTSHVIGTPQYISPEQAMGKPIDGRTDIYSLGVMMYEMLTGALPFHDKDPDILLRKHIKSRPVPIRELSIPITVNPALEDLVMECLEKSPKARPPGMEDIVSRLSTIVLER